MDERPRLPPGQTWIDRMPALHMGAVPAFDRSTWDLRVEGEVLTPLRLTYDEVRAFPRVIATSDFHCVEGWSIMDCAWEGVRFSDLAEAASPTERARFATIGCERDYTTSLPVGDLMHPDVILAWGLDGRDLAPEHGFPLRLIVPHKYAYKSAKWVRWVRFTYEQELGYWETRGYSNGADPWKEERWA